MSLSNQQVRKLRAEAHRLKLKPVVTIGQHGLSENVLTELESSLHHHELLKIRLPGLEKSDKKRLREEICLKLGADLIQHIGHVIVVFRRNTESPRFQKLLKD